MWQAFVRMKSTVFPRIFGLTSAENQGNTCTVDRPLNAATTIVAVISIKAQGSPCEAAYGASLGTKKR